MTLNIEEKENGQRKAKIDDFMSLCCRRKVFSQWYIQKAADMAHQRQGNSIYSRQRQKVEHEGYNMNFLFMKNSPINMNMRNGIAVRNIRHVNLPVDVSNNQLTAIA